MPQLIKKGQSSCRVCQELCLCREKRNPNFDAVEIIKMELHSKAISANKIRCKFKYNIQMQKR